MIKYKLDVYILMFIIIIMLMLLLFTGIYSVYTDHLQIIGGNEINKRHNIISEQMSDSHGISEIMNNDKQNHNTNTRIFTIEQIKILLNSDFYSRIEIPPFTRLDLLSIYAFETLNNIKTINSKLLSVGEKILYLYNIKTPILEIAYKLKFPPVSILKQLLSELKFESHEIENVLRNKIPKRLPDTIAKQLKNIFTFDFISDLNIRKRRNDDLAFVQNIIKKLKLRNFTKISNSTLYFKSGVVINDTEIHWISIKNYIYTDSPTCKRVLLREQLKLSKYGRGCFVFTGAVENAFIGDTLIIIDE